VRSRNLIFTLTVALGLGVPVQAQQFKGHEIGESTATFFSKEQDALKMLNDCKAAPPRELGIEEIKRQYGKQYLKDYEAKTAANPGSKIPVYDKPFDVYQDKCEEILHLESGRTAQINSKGYRPRNPHFAAASAWAETASFSDRLHWNTTNTVMTMDYKQFGFKDGHLVYLRVWVSNEPFSAIEADIEKRLGTAPIGQVSTPMHNAMGGTWTDETLSWKTSSLFVSLYQNGDPAAEGYDHVAYITAETLERHDAEEAAAKNRPSSLD
jgi:hypothetical protein